MSYWLMKSEPNTYSIDHLQQAKAQTGFWDGVRNYQARNLIRDKMQVGDLAFFYHSNCKIPGIMGIVEITQSAHPDETAFDPNSKYFDPTSNPKNPRWFGVNVTLVEKFIHIIPLRDLRKNSRLKDMQLLKKGNRLSVSPVSASEWQAILRMKNSIDSTNED
jgi:predicted RNA-binding protein with PUA-like domain